MAGFVDAAGFVALFGLFTSHVTGNFVLIGAELVSTSSGVIAKLLALPAFVLAVAATRLIALALERRGIAPLRRLLALQAVLLALFCIAGLALAPLRSADGPDAILVGMLGVAAMGVQNAIARLALAHLAATTVMTVNVTQAVIDAVDLLRLGKARAGAARGRLGRMLPAVAAFAAGAIAGAFGVAHLSFGCLILPIAVLAGLIALPERADAP
ncbi:YoaK family protein [Methylobacterium nigriterrae]|uniref:YoaK family protein n=1 Tax=Methylobacterium nigriterrae TaxID=3127512 RepID=UPI00301374CB